MSDNTSLLNVPTKRFTRDYDITTALITLCKRGYQVKDVYITSHEIIFTFK